MTVTHSLQPWPITTRPSNVRYNFLYVSLRFIA